MLHNSRIAVLEAQVTDLTGQVTTLQSQLAEVTQGRDAAQTQLAQANASLETLRADLAAAQTARQAAEATAATAQASITEQVTARLAAAGVDPVDHDPAAKTENPNPHAGLSGLAKARALLQEKQPKK